MGLLKNTLDKSSKNISKHKKKIVAGAVAATLLAGGTIGIQSLTTSTPVTTAPTTTIPYKRWFNANASWNLKASSLGRAPDQYQQYAQRMYTYGGGTAPPGTFRVAFGDYSIPWYSTTQATTTARIYQTTSMQAKYTLPYLPIGSTIPWNPAWKAATGNDNLMAIINEATGEVWELNGVGQLKINCLDLIGPNARAGYDINNSRHLCLFGGAHYTNLYTASDKDNTTVNRRGMGINKQALITRAIEVKNGVIPHALEMTISNKMFGPACTPINNWSADGFGTSCGAYVKPATKLERINANVGCGTQLINNTERMKTVPDGMRFAINITDAGIEKWLDSRNYTGNLRQTARVFAVALRDYGWLAAETGCYGAHIETDSSLWGNAASIWQSLGIVKDGTNVPKRDLITGLITPQNIYVVNPPA